ncbi:MAG TPA: hypothetical protein VHU80_23915 [Polyangiaceae bacterium]|jgi:hypothetical protein|nr:hypothetical protein [Polyangiaceae bacterium]
MIRIACFALASSLVVLLTACSSSEDSTGGDKNSGPAAGAGGSKGMDSGAVSEDFAATAEDFTCIENGTHVRKFFVKNALGHDAETLAVANAGQGKYPVGTMIQLVPQEAMVKRRDGFSAASGDWEFFSLSPTAAGTNILTRGTTDVLNVFNLNCLDCHVKAEPQYDFVCETGHGCDPLPLTTDQIMSLQDTDPRCAAADAGK